MFDHQYPDLFRLPHAELCPGRALDLAGVGQPGLLELQATPFGDGFVVYRFQAAEPDRQVTALVPRVNDAQRAADVSDQNEDQYQ
jgi:hypothetical protein